MAKNEHSLQSKKKNLNMADGIKVLILEKEFAGLCRLGLPVSLCLQLQRSGLKLADALWTQSHPEWFLSQPFLAFRY